MNEVGSGRVLYVDVSERTSHIDDLAEDVISKYIGGMGVNNYLAHQMVRPGTAPLSAESRIIIGAGLLGGTSAPASGKIMATYKMPANGALGTSYGGGNMGAVLRWAGLTNLVVSGKSAAPVYLLVIDGIVTFCPAEDLWGRGIIDTTDELWKRHGGDCSVIAIGPAGEREVNIAIALVDNVGTLGRGGLGAVMGSKRIKAIVVKGTQGIRVSNPSGFLKACGEVNKRVTGLKWRNDWIRFGIYTGWNMWTKVGLVVENWTKVCPKEVSDALGPQQYAKNHFQYPLACSACPACCKAGVRVDEDGKTGVYPTSYGMHAALAGNRWYPGDLNKAFRLYVRHNQDGIDDLMLTSLIEFAVELYKRGIIGPADTGGLELDFKLEVFEELDRMITHRIGIGDILAGGFLEAIRHFGPESEPYAVHVKGMDPFVDQRYHTSSMLWSQLCNPRGMYGIPGNTPGGFVPGRSPDAFRRYLLTVGATQEESARAVPGKINMPRVLKWAEDFYALCSALGICARQPIIQSYDVDIIAELYSAATGRTKDRWEVTRDGERIWNIYRLVNAREGFRRQDDRMPARLLEPLKDEDAGVAYRAMDYERQNLLTMDDVDRGLTEYYEERGWDSATGNPTSEKLAHLDIP
jgi:aldehyde:ferredoxin oxidoreductase